MDRNKLTPQAKVKASTMLEVVVAMVMIILVFGIAMMIFANVLNSSLSVKKIRAQAILQETFAKTVQSNEFTTQSFTVDSLRIDQEVKAYSGNAQLFDVHLTAYDANQQKIAELEKVTIKQ